MNTHILKSSCFFATIAIVSFGLGIGEIAHAGVCDQYGDTNAGLGVDPNTGEQTVICQQPDGSTCFAGDGCANNSGGTSGSGSTGNDNGGGSGGGGGSAQSQYPGDCANPANWTWTQYWNWEYLEGNTCACDHVWELGLCVSGITPYGQVVDEGLAFCESTTFPANPFCSSIPFISQ